MRRSCPVTSHAFRRVLVSRIAGFRRDSNSSPQDEGGTPPAAGGGRPPGGLRARAARRAPPPGAVADGGVLPDGRVLRRQGEVAGAHRALRPERHPRGPPPGSPAASETAPAHRWCSRWCSPRRWTIRGARTAGRSWPARRVCTRPSCSSWYPAGRTGGASTGSSADGSGTWMSTPAASGRSDPAAPRCRRRCIMLPTPGAPPGEIPVKMKG